MDYQSSHLNVEGDPYFELGRQELTSSIEHAHGPDSWNHHAAVALGNGRDSWVLVDGNEDLVR